MLAAILPYGHAGQSLIQTSEMASIYFEETRWKTFPPKTW